MQITVVWRKSRPYNRSKHLNNLNRKSSARLSCSSESRRGPLAVAEIYLCSKFCNLLLCSFFGVGLGRFASYSPQPLSNQITPTGSAGLPLLLFRRCEHAFQLHRYAVLQQPATSNQRHSGSSCTPRPRWAGLLLGRAESVLHIPAAVRAGIHANLVVPNPAKVGPGATSMAQLLPNYPSVESLEDPNEYDQSGNVNWATDLRNYLPVVWQTGQQTGVPVLGPSLTQNGSYGKLGDVSAYMDFGNLHVYWGGRNPETGGWGGPDPQMHYYGSLPYDFDFLNIDSPG